MTDYGKAMRNALMSGSIETLCVLVSLWQALKRHASQIVVFAVEIRKNAVAKEMYDVIQSEF